MNKLKKIAMLSLLSLSTAMIATTQAKADEKDGTIERFTCLDLGVPDNHLKGTFVKLNASDQGKKLGFGGGDMALKLSNDGLNAGTLYTGTGAAATFVVAEKREGIFQIYFKPGKVTSELPSIHLLQARNCSQREARLSHRHTVELQSHQVWRRLVHLR